MYNNHNGVRPVLMEDNINIPMTDLNTTSLTSWFSGLSLDNGRIGSLKTGGGADNGFFNGDHQQIFIFNKNPSDEIKTRIFNHKKPI